jgi:hypothetical protein
LNVASVAAPLDRIHVISYSVFLLET